MRLFQTGLRVVGAFAGTLISFGTAADTIIDDSNSVISSGTVVWEEAGSPYIITTSVQVNGGATLEIRPGVTVRFAGPYQIAVNNGALVARGTPDKKITFTSNSDAAVAASILFGPNTVDAVFDANGFVSGSILENTIVEKLGGARGAVELQSATPYLRGNVFRNNTSYGANAYDFATDLRIHANEFTAVDGTGGVAGLVAGLIIKSLPGSAVDIRENHFTRNSGRGAWVEVGGTATLISNTFAENQGGLYISGSGSNTATLSNNTYRQNAAGGGDSGGGIHARNIQLIINGDSLTGNTAIVNGGGLYTLNANLTMTNSLVEGNTALAMGGGLFLNSQTSTITDSVVVNNTSSSHSGGIDLHGDDTSFGGGGLVTIDRCVIAANQSVAYGAGVGFSVATGTLTNSTIAQNYGGPSVQAYLQGNGRATTISNNTITQNVTANAAIRFDGTGGAINIPPPTNTFNGSYLRGNNLFGNNATWNVFNNLPGTDQSPSLLDVSSNWWGTTESSQIASRLEGYDTTSQLVVDPIATNIYTTNPISPPSGVTVTSTGTSYLVQWNANPETDLAGYRVHLGTRGAPYFDQHFDVPNGTSYEITGLDGGNYFVAVTAYDSEAAATPDDPATPVNEKQTSGHESWYSEVKPLIVVDTDLEMSVVARRNGTPEFALRNGDLMSFRVSVTNHGPSDGVSPSSVEVGIPAGFTLGTTAGCTANNLIVTCSIPPVKLNETQFIDIVATVATASTDAFTVSAQIVASDPDPNPANNQTTHTFFVNRPDVALAWTAAPASGAVDQPITYRLTARNLGRVAASNVVVTIPLPANTRAILSSGACAATNDIITCSAATLATYGSEQTFEFTLTAAQTGDLVVSASVTVQEPELNLANNILAATTAIASSVGGGSTPPVDPPPSGSTSGKRGGGAIDALMLALLVTLPAVQRRRFRSAVART